MSWLSCIREAAPGAGTLICFPPAGAGVAAMSGWRAYLPASQGLHVVCLPGRDHRRDEPARYGVHEAAEEILPAISELHLDSVVLFGHSLGAMLAFEVARRCHRSRSLRHLFVAACAAPQLPRRLPELSGLDAAEFLPQVKQRYGGLDDRLLGEDGWVAEALPRLRADLRMAETYRYQPGPPLDCPLTAFGGCDDATVSPAEVAAWSEQTASSFRHQFFPGGHFFPQTAARQVARAVGQTLEQV